MRPNEAFKLQANSRDEAMVDIKEEKEFILSFEINDGLFGMNFEKVHEVVDYFKARSYPTQVEGHVGIINLRGVVIPIIDPFGMDLENTSTDKCKYIVFESNNGNLVGIVVYNSKKIEVEKSIIEGVDDHKVINYNGSPLRYLNADAILKNYRDKIDE